MIDRRPRNGSEWSAEYHSCYYVSKRSSWSVVFKLIVCHLGKLCIIPVFKMASKTVARTTLKVQTMPSVPVLFYYCACFSKGQHGSPNSLRWFISAAVNVHPSLNAYMSVSQKKLLFKMQFYMFNRLCLQYSRPHLLLDGQESVLMTMAPKTLYGGVMWCATPLTLR